MTRPVQLGDRIVLLGTDRGVEPPLTIERPVKLYDYSTPHFKAQAEWMNKAIQKDRDRIILEAFESMLKTEAGGRGSRGSDVL